VEPLLLQARLYRERNRIERFFSKHFRRVATRYEKLAANFLAMVHLNAPVVASLRVYGLA
jgi:transposase